MADIPPLLYTMRSKRQSRHSALLIVGLFLLTITVFAILFGAGEMIHGS